MYMIMFICIAYIYINDVYDILLDLGIFEPRPLQKCEIHKVFHEVCNS